MGYEVIKRTERGYFSVAGTYYGSIDEAIEMVLAKVGPGHATIFLYPQEPTGTMHLAVDTQPNHNWGSWVEERRQIIGTYGHKKLAELIRTYAPFL